MIMLQRQLHYPDAGLRYRTTDGDNLDNSETGTELPTFSPPLLSRQPATRSETQQTWKGGGTSR